MRDRSSCMVSYSLWPNMLLQGNLGWSVNMTYYLSITKLANVYFFLRENSLQKCEHSNKRTKQPTSGSTEHQVQCYKILLCCINETEQNRLTVFSFGCLYYGLYKFKEKQCRSNPNIYSAASKFSDLLHFVEKCTYFI